MTEEPDVSTMHPSLGPVAAFPLAPLSLGGTCPTAFTRGVVTIGDVEVLRMPTNTDGQFFSFDAPTPDLEPGPAEAVFRCYDLAGAILDEQTLSFEVLDPALFLADLDDARRRWARHEPPAYVYDWWAGGFWGTGFPDRTTVVDGVVTIVEPAIPPDFSPDMIEDTLAEEAELGPAEQRTVEDQFDEIEATFHSHPASIDVEYDEWFGYPTQLRVDQIDLIVDEEWSLILENFAEITLPIPPPPAALPAPPVPGTPVFTG